LYVVNPTFSQRTAAAVASEKAAASERDEKKRELEEALEKIQLLEAICAATNDTLRQTQSQLLLFEVSQKALLQNMAQMVQTQPTCRDDAATSPRHNAFDDFNADLKLQVEAGRSLIDALRQQLCDEQERADVLQKQLTKEKEQVVPMRHFYPSFFVTFGFRATRCCCS
jgi:hypothetical protein